MNSIKLLKWHKISFLWLILFSMIGVSLWLNSKSSFLIFRYVPWLTLAQVCGILAITNLSLNFLFTTRLSVVKFFFGSLQQVYKIHKCVGILGVSFAVLHLTFFLIHATYYPHLFKFYLIPSDYWSLNFARIAFCLFVVLTVITFINKVPYHIWKSSHQFMGLAFFFAVLHVLTVKSDVKNDAMLRFWILGLMSVGLLSFIYTKFLYYYIGPNYHYIVSKIEHLKDNTLRIYLKPLKKTLRFEPAQFIFLSVLNNEIGKEVHPFTVISSNDEEYLQISPKKCGDYTKRLKYLEIGTLVKIWGPYGHFGEKFLLDERDQVWIAGGIGITPFISMISYENTHPMKAKKWLFYCTRASDNSAYGEFLESKIKGTNISLIKQHSNEDGYLTAEQIHSIVSNFENKLFLICGPPLMRDSLVKQLQAYGVKKTQIFYEDFTLR